MRVPEVMRKAVVFLYCTRRGQFGPAGTGFLVGYPVAEYPVSFIMAALTAQHVIDGIRRESDDGKVTIRFNAAERARSLETTVDAWRQGASNVDCALLPWDGPRGDHLLWPLEDHTVATDEVIRREGFGIGDEVFMVGLFRNHLGRNRIEPILRVGNIAAIPADPIRTKPFGDMRAILIEARSIGGLSGSPVFVHMGLTRWREGRVMMSEGESPFFFLGLMHGHWDALETDVDDAMRAEREKVNMGIGIVVPAEEVLRSIRPLLEAGVVGGQKRLADGREPTLDAAPAADSEFERFEDLTRRLVKVPKKELDEKLAGDDERQR